MTWSVKTRGASSAPIVSDYRCPEHGLFEAVTERPAPDWIECTVCDAESPWTVSAVRLRFPAFVSVSRGKSDEKPHPYVLDTEPLADGRVTLDEFRKQREKLWRAADADADPDRPRKAYSR